MITPQSQSAAKIKFPVSDIEHNEVVNLNISYGRALLVNVASSNILRIIYLSLRCLLS